MYSENERNFSYMSRATDLGRMFSAPTHGCLRAKALKVS